MMTEPNYSIDRYNTARPSCNIAPVSHTVHSKPVGFAKRHQEHANSEMLVESYTSFVLQSSIGSLFSFGSSSSRRLKSSATIVCNSIASSLSSW
mmetsp:Transcript_26087/g.43515  ORF Transcript_26087/g.43515 Transcript_26087/m.43515 type:complete len:94 (+) Transcript_26087:345-626(+)